MLLLQILQSTEGGQEMGPAEGQGAAAGQWPDPPRCHSWQGEARLCRPRSGLTGSPGSEVVAVGS